MKLKQIEQLVENLINLSTRQWAVVRRHESRMMQDYANSATYAALSAMNGRVKYPELIRYAETLSYIQHNTFDTYCGLIQLIQSERDKKRVVRQKHTPEWYKAKHAEYQRRYRAKKSGRTDAALKEFDARLKKVTPLLNVGLPRPKSLTHAQQMKAQLDAYIAEEERQHGTGNVSTTQD